MPDSNSKSLANLNRALQGKGAGCSLAGAVVPMHDGTCDWCGRQHPVSHVWTSAGWAATDTLA